jgi:hypothetical protein
MIHGCPYAARLPTSFPCSELHLAPAGSVQCDYGLEAAQAICGAAVLSLAAAQEVTPGRVDLQVGGGGACLDGGWGSVPLGCSAQSGGDWAGYFRLAEAGDNASAACLDSDYQLVCTGKTFSALSLFHICWNI